MGASGSNSKSNDDWNLNGCFTVCSSINIGRDKDGISINGQQLRDAFKKQNEYTMGLDLFNLSLEGLGKNNKKEESKTYNSNI